MAPKTRTNKGVSPIAPAPTTPKGKAKAKGKDKAPPSDNYYLNCLIEGRSDITTVEVVGNRNIAWVKKLVHQDGPTGCPDAIDLLLLKVTTSQSARGP